jgi:DNA-binding transcriptional MerR regulator
MTVMKRHRNNNSKVSVKYIMRKYKLSYQSVNHYTDFGLLPVPEKKGNVRFYDGRLVDKRIRKMRALMGEGYSLRLIRKKLLGV